MLIVQKYGGTSVKDLDRIRTVAQRIIKYREVDHDIVVVVSAMAGETDRLLGLAHSINLTPDEREVDVLISTGEQVVSALLAIMLKTVFCDAVSLVAHQARIITDSNYTKARISRIEKSQILSELSKGRVVVVPGFQGVDEKGNITTLGRGGSDTSAVALAAALEADLCEIYTDVDGVYTADPNICAKARKLGKISFDEMLEMASLGAKVLQIRSVEFAKRYNVPILVKSSYTDGEGTLVCKEAEDMEKMEVTGITFNKNEVKITINKVPDKPGVAAKIFTALSDANIVIDVIVQNTGHRNTTDITFTVAKADAKKAQRVSEEAADEVKAGNVAVDEDIAKVSIVGLGMRSHAGIASRMFTVLAKEGINIGAITTSEIKISCVIHAKYGELAVRALHKAFGLDANSVEEDQ
jgi:aspartate kinase